jgi:hypothetical protein
VEWEKKLCEIFNSLKPSFMRNVNSSKGVGVVMETNKLLSSLCYFSIFFAGFIFPIIIYFIVEDRDVKKHAKVAFLSHLLPVIAVPIVIAGVFFDIGILATGSGFPLFMSIGIGISVLLSVIVMIWNIYRGIKILL